MSIALGKKDENHGNTQKIRYVFGKSVEEEVGKAP